MECAGETWILEGGAYWASESSIEIDVDREKSMTAFKSGEGLLDFQTKVSGHGTVVLASQGPVEVVHLQNDKLTVDGRLVLAHGRREDFLGDVGDFPVAGAVTTPDALAPVLAAVAAAWALGLSTELIRSGIGTFDPALPRERNQHPWK
jgi:cyanophycin synthetase